jgi:16S rRNA (cytosine1402-N4)-methyltransferase
VNHVPALLAQVVRWLALQPGALCIDGTLGGGGHAEALLLATAPDGKLLGLDADPAAVTKSQIRLVPFGERATLVNANFRDLAAVAAAHRFTGVQAVLLDLGLSSFHLAQPERGFSFAAEGPLDMRMNPRTPLTAAEIVNDWPVEALADVIYRYGEEPRSWRIARAIVAARPLATTTGLAAVIAQAVGGKRERIHPATQVFQALRIKVNDELGALEAVLPQIVMLLAPAGRLAVISFHSLEDRIVKQFIQRETRDCLCPADLPRCVCGHRATLKAITKKPIEPDETEVRENPRSRSAKLRIAEKV